MKTAGTPPNQKSNRIHLEQNTNTFATAFHTHRKGVSECSNSKRFVLRKRTAAQFSKKRYNNYGTRNSYRYGYGKYKPGNLVQQSEISLCSSSGGSKTHTSLHKKLILCKANSKCAVSRQVKIFFRELENSNKRHRNYIVKLNSSSTEKHPNSQKLIQEEKILEKEGIQEMLNK